MVLKLKQGRTNTHLDATENMKSSSCSASAENNEAAIVYKDGEFFG